MSKSWDDLTARVTANEAAIEETRAFIRDNAYSGMARREDAALDKRIDRAGRIVSTVPLNMRPAGSSGWLVTNLVPDTAFDASAATLGETRQVLGTLIDALEEAGVVVNASGTTSRFLHVAGGTEKIALVEIVSQDAFTASGTDYWTFTLYRMRGDETVGVTLATYSLASRSLVAMEPVTLLESAVGEPLVGGDVLRLVVTPTGSPVTLTDVSVRLTIQRMTR